MNWHTLVTTALSVLLILFYTPTGDAIHCYACTSQYDINCGDTSMLSSAVPYIDCSAKKGAQQGNIYDKCKKIVRPVGSTGTNNIIIRDCATRDSSSSSTECIRKANGDYACYCDKDGCNGGHFPSRG